MSNSASPARSCCPRLSAWFVVAAGLVLLALVYWMHAQEMFVRAVLSQLAVILWLLIAAIWWVFFTGPIRWKTLRYGLAGLGALLVLAFLTLKWDGSADGANPFKFTWKWTPAPDAGLELAPVAATLKPQEIPTADPDLADFPSFLGKNGDGSIPVPGLAENWSAQPPQELWRIRVGLGWSSFAVVGDRAVTQEQRGEMELVTCYAVKTGELQWSHSQATRFSESMGGDGPRATPTIRDGVVYALGATGHLHALDLATGKALWTRDTLKDAESGNIDWGKANSPLVVGDLVIVTAGLSPTTGLLAYRRDTGDLAWKSGRGPASYSTPRVLEIGGVRQIVAVLGDNVAGFDPVSGAEFWRFDWPGPFPKVAQPLLLPPDQILVTSSYGIPSKLIAVKKTESGWSATAVWSKQQMKTKFGSSVLIGTHAYGLDEGKLIAMDATTGERVWKGDRFGYGQNLLVGKDKLLIQAESGDVVLVRVSPEGATELGRISPLHDKTWNAPALAGKYLLVRNDREAVALKLP